MITAPTYDPTVEITSEDTHRLLAYVGALNQHGVKPEPRLVDVFADSPKRRAKRTGRANGLDVFAQVSIMMAGKVVFTETASEHLIRLGWAASVGAGLELTAAGWALLKALNAPAMESESIDFVEVVMAADDPFAYARVIHAIGAAGESLLVDPYLRWDQFHDIMKLDNVTRVLVGPRLQAHEYTAMALGLGSLPPDRRLEVRKASNVHDRYLIPERHGRVLMFGTSLNGVGRRVSTFTTLGDVSTDALRAAHEDIWSAAEVIERSSDEAEPDSAPRAIS